MHVFRFLVALAAAGLMGFANQRGGTCTVAAIREIVVDHRFKRLLALLEASLWVGGGLLLLNAANVLPTMPPGYAFGFSTVVGGILFGLGAFVNRACLFGTVARLGSGEWPYISTPIGLFAGSLAASGFQTASPLTETSIVFLASGFGGFVSLILFAIRLATHCIAIQRQKWALLQHIWSPHVATTIIGLAFLIAFLAAGRWEYADFVADLAHGNTNDWLTKALLALALLSGAIFGGWTDRSRRAAHYSPTRLFRHAAGGFLMGLGASIIPGGNTGLILLGLPMLWPYAWLALVCICLTIYLATIVSRRALHRPLNRD